MKWSICSHSLVQFTIWRWDLISLEALSRFFCVLFFCRVLFLFFGLGLSFLPKERLCRFTGFPMISQLLFQQIFGSSYQQQQLFSLRHFKFCLLLFSSDFLSLAVVILRTERKRRSEDDNFIITQSRVLFISFLCNRNKRGNTLLDWDDVASSLQSHCLFLIFIECMYRTTNQQNLWSPFVMSFGCCCCRLFVQF